MSAHKKQAPLLMEVQGLRAIAVLVVLIFHIWPSALTGGYIGVDVFFVISGYLITGLLLREAQRSGTISLTSFYARRIRRLLPASTLVIVAAAVAVVLLPRVQWEHTAKEILASTFYVQNWWLAHQAVDYLAEDNAAGILQHYWSLSVEEQYYIVWPLLFLLATLSVKAARQRPGLVFGCLIGGIFIASLVYSIHLSSTNPPLAYFATTTRAWELAIGGLLAITPQTSQALRGVWAALAGWVGLLAIFLACLLFDEGTVFPGYAALLPTLGAALVIVAGNTPYWWSSYRLLANRPMQFIGDISYSLYLWHWPVIIIYRLQVNDDLGLPDGVLIMLVSIVLAAITKVLVEDPFRHNRRAGDAGANHPFAIGALSFALTLFAANYIWLINSEVSLGSDSAQLMTADPRKMLQRPYDPSQPLMPPLLDARKDNPDVYRLKCHANQVSSEPSKCDFGSPEAPHHVVLVGDSHAAQWLPSLQALLESRPEWRITTFTKSVCTFNATPVSLGKERLENTSCTEWNQRVMAELRRLEPDVVVTSQSSGHRAYGAVTGEESQQLLAGGLLERWQQLRELGANVLVVRDTPWMDQNPVECLSAPGAVLENCATKSERAFKSDSILLAMKQNPPVSFLDLSNRICDSEWCWPVQGQVLLWRDRHHLTATYARALSREFASILELAKK